jgi:hypothetical protein
LGAKVGHGELAASIADHQFADALMIGYASRAQWCFALPAADLWRVAFAWRCTAGLVHHFLPNIANQQSMLSWPMLLIADFHETFLAASKLNPFLLTCYIFGHVANVSADMSFLKRSQRAATFITNRSEGRKFFHVLTSLVFNSLQQRPPTPL